MSAEAMRRYRERHPERARESSRRSAAAHRDRNLAYNREYSRTRYHGITRMIRDWMYESQDQACAGCKASVPDAELQVDHDHACCPTERSCGRCVRGLLCRSCNLRDALAEVFG